MSVNEKLTIGKLAKRASVNVETVRFYERRGILQQPRSTGSVRLYPHEYIERIKFVKRSQELGFTLNEVIELLELKVKGKATCRDALDITEKKMKEIDEKIRDLKKMKKSLKSFSSVCADENILLKNCPVLATFLMDEGKCC